MEQPNDIVAWQRLGEALTTSGRLKATDIDRLAELGVRRVVNLSHPSDPDVLADEAELLAERAIDYVHIPVPFDSPDDAHFEAFNKALDAPGPLHVHCMANWRVSAFFYRRHRRQGMDEAEARALLEQQWNPDESPYAAKTWAEFIRRP